MTLEEFRVSKFLCVDGVAGLVCAMRFEWLPLMMVRMILRLSF